jgi:16S rRNA (guanine527-N7)-methyltransferase
MQGSILNCLQDPRIGLDSKNVTDLVVPQIKVYLELLVKWNQKINLTAQKQPEDILFRHVFDSLQYCRFIKPHFRLLDIGSGAGFPGIPLKIIFPNLQLVLVESQRKRCSFLETVVRDLQFDDVVVINSRAEDISDNEEGKFDAVSFRAVTDLESCLFLGDRFVPCGGIVVVKKSPEETLDSTAENSRFVLNKEVIITSHHGVESSLLAFEKCFT